MDLALDQSEIAAWLLILARLLGWMWIDPVISRLPWFLRLFFAGTLAWVWVPAMTAPRLDPFAWSGFILLAGEFLFGAALGLVVRMFFAVAEVALQTLGLTASLGLSQVVPEEQVGMEWPLRQLAFWLALFAFVSANGHGMVIHALSTGFAAMPMAMPASDAARQLADMGGMLLASGLQLALPMLVLVLLAHFAFAMLSRMLPGVDAISMGLTLGAVGLLAGLAVALPLALAGLGKVLERFPDALRLLIP